MKRTEKDWCDIGTDLSIEQIVMKSLKGQGRVIGRSLTENVSRVWGKTMHRLAEITEAVDNLSAKS